MSVENWAEVRRLHRVEGMAIKAIARRLGLTQRGAQGVGSRRRTEVRPAGAGSIVDAVDSAIRELLQGCPTMPATVIAERIGWTRSITVLTDRVRELRPYYQPADPASRTEHDPGDRCSRSAPRRGSWCGTTRPQSGPGGPASRA